MNGDGEVAGESEFVDDGVNGGEELLQVLGGAGFFSDPVKGRAESFGALAFGDIAINRVKSLYLAIDNERGGGD